jgi:hypothetical protein
MIYIQNAWNPVETQLPLSIATQAHYRLPLPTTIPPADAGWIRLPCLVFSHPILFLRMNSFWALIGLYDAFSLPVTVHGIRVIVLPATQVHTLGEYLPPRFSGSCLSCNLPHPGSDSGCNSSKRSIRTSGHMDTGRLETYVAQRHNSFNVQEPRQTILHLPPVCYSPAE